MKTILLAAVAIGIASTTVVAQDFPPKPTDHHKILHQEVGVWDADITIWLPGTDGKSIKSKGVETIKKYGELWTQSEFKYDYMGAQTSGRGTFGYDTSSKKFVGTWIEEGAPYMSTMTGTYDAKTKTMTYDMKGKDPQGKDMPYRITIKRVADGKKDFTMFAKMPGSDKFTKMMLIRFTLKKETSKK